MHVPAAVELAQEIAARLEAQHRQDGAVIEEAYQREKCYRLCHALGDVLELGSGLPSADCSWQEEWSAHGDVTKPLWQALDDFVAIEQLHGSLLPSLGAALPKVSARGQKSDDEVWNEFWEHYRHCRSRGEEPEVLRGSEMSARGARRWGLGSGKLSARIRSASENFRCHERTCEPLPPSVADSRAETPLDRASISSKDREVPQLSRRMTPMTPQKPWTPSTRADEHGATNTSRPSSKASHRPSSKDTRRKSSISDYKDKGANSKNIYSDWGFVTDTYVEEEPDLISCCAKDVKALGSARLPPLKGFQDYKDRQQTSTHIAEKTPGQECASASHRALTAAREVRSVQEYRRSRTQEACQLDSSRGRMPGRFSARHGKTPRRHKQFSFGGTRDGSMSCELNAGCRDYHPAPAFHRPWSREQSGRCDLHKKPAEVGTRLTSVERFAELCRSVGVHPKPASVQFLVKLLPCLDLHDAGYSDQDILALAAALPYRDASKIESVDLGENLRLTDSSVCEFLQALADMHARTLKSVLLKGCSRLTCQTASLVIRLLHERFVELEVLDMSGITISAADYQKFARISKDHKRLRDVRLANTGLGLVGTASATNIVTCLVTNGRLHTLELGWNSLDTTVFRALGQGLVAQRRLTSLGLANTGPCSDPNLNGSPILIFLEHLARDKSLTTLDISNNALDKDAPLVLESALSCHPSLQCINISTNPLGLHGKRSLLRLVASPHNPKLTRLDMSNCNAIISDPVFRNSFGCDPSGHYRILLSQPAPRAFLQLLLRRVTSQHEGIPLSRLMHHAVFRADGVEAAFDLQSISQGEDALQRVPSYGELIFELDASAMISTRAKCSPSEALESCVRGLRLEINVVNKAHAVLGLVKGAKTEPEWCELLEALSYDFVLTPDQITALCITRLLKPTCGNQPVATFCRLLPCIEKAAQVRHAVSACSRNLGDVVRIHRTCHSLLSLNLENPTNSYSLDLSTACERCVAEHLVLLNQWELQLWRGAGCVDVSQTGNAKNFRNVMHNDQALIWEMGEWRFPAQDKFSFDYVSLQRPPCQARPISLEIWSKAVAHVSRSVSGQDGEKRASNTVIVEAMRAVSSNFWISCAQLRDLLTLCQDPGLRQQFVTCFLLRTVDWPANGKLCRSKFSKQDWLHLELRLGHLQMFNFLQPEDLSLSLDLSIYEQRRILSLVVGLTAVEHPGNLRSPRIKKSDQLGSQLSVWDTFAAGVPKSWKEFEQCPTEGFFEATYVCSQENKQLRARRRLALELGGWNTLPEDLEGLESMVQWWSVLDDMPSELVLWLDFLVSNFESLEQAFDACDASRDKRLNLREFLAGMQQLGFRLPRSLGAKKKRNGKRNKEASETLISNSSKSDEEVRVLTVVYRFLDPNGDGEVTVNEFKALSGMWKELQHTTWEFVCHVRLAFGSVERAWQIADKDGSGVLSNDEFIDFSRNSKFQGPVQQIYMYLDRDDNGSIGNEEWMALDCITRPEW